MLPPQRKIIHIDCDCFYASIEMRDKPELADIPLAVGGNPHTRGVIATCNYIARRFGVHSAMSSAKALTLCPDLLIVPPDMKRYREASEQIMQIYQGFTNLIEPLSLDEAYLDVTAQPHHHGSATLMAQAIRQQIADEVGITASAGIAPNKFLAKIASDWNKPNGQFVITPDQVAAFIAELPVKKVHGVGKVTAKQLHALGITTCGDMQHWALADLIRHFGRFGERLHELSRGIDHREVSTDRAHKSISVEETYPEDLPDLATCEAKLPELLSRLQVRMDRNEVTEFKGVTVKLKFADFSQTTVEHKSQLLDPNLIRELLQTGYQRGNKPVRLLGVGVRLSGAETSVSGHQLSLFSQLSDTTPTASS